MIDDNPDDFPPPPKAAPKRKAKRRKSKAPPKRKATRRGIPCRDPDVDLAVRLAIVFPSSPGCPAAWHGEFGEPEQSGVFELVPGGLRRLS